MSQTTLRSIVLIPKFTGGLSMIGSSLIVIDILKDRSTKLKKVFHRLMFTMSVCDFFLSFTFFLSTWPIPKDDPDAPWLAAGNDATCTAQGFFMQFFVIATFYNAYLSIYYVLVIVHGWQESQLVRFEYGVHVFSFLYASVTAFTALALGMYGSNFLVWCFINASWEQQIAFNIAWQWTAFCIVVFFMAYLWWNVRSQFGRLKKYGARPHLKASLKQSQTSSAATDPRQSQLKSSQTRSNPMSLIATQALLYSASFLLTASANVAVCIAYYTKPVGSIPLWVLQYGNTVLPLQGLWNCLIYYRPRYLQRQEAKRREKLRKSHTLRGSSTVNQPQNHNASAAADSSVRHPKQPQEQEETTPIATALTPKVLAEDTEFFDEDPDVASSQVLDDPTTVCQDEDMTLHVGDGNMVGPEDNSASMGGGG